MRNLPGIRFKEIREPLPGRFVNVDTELVRLLVVQHACLFDPDTAQQSRILLGFFSTRIGNPGGVPETAISIKPTGKVRPNVLDRNLIETFTSRKKLSDERAAVDVQVVSRVLHFDTWSN